MVVVLESRSILNVAIITNAFSYMHGWSTCFTMYDYSTVRNGAEVVCVRNVLLCVRWANSSLRKSKRE